MSSAEVVVEVARGGVVESRHRGIISAVDGKGREVASLGDTTTVTFLRSSAKPFQTIPVIADGAADHFGLTEPEIAIMAGSHSGQAMHVAAVKRILSKIGLSEEALRCGGHLPFDPESAALLNGSPTPLHNNCSGKHAGMLAMAMHLGMDHTAYDSPDHPVQQRIRDIVAMFSETTPAGLKTGIDGCGAPNFAISLRNMALAYRALAGSDRESIPPGIHSAARRVTHSMINHPEMVAGTHGRFDTDLMTATAGRVIAKVGAEGIHTLGVFPSARYPSGLGIAVKIEDGDDRRVRGMVVLETIRQLQVINEPELSSLKAHQRRVIRNHRGDVVGDVYPAFQLSQHPPDCPS